MSSPAPTRTVPVSRVVNVRLVQAGEEHWVQVTGWALGPYLAVTPALQAHQDNSGSLLGFVPTGLWVVTHIPTGYAVPSMGGASACIDHAIGYAQALADSDIDWNRDRDAFRADRAVREIIRDLGHGFANCDHDGDCRSVLDEDW